MCCSPSPIRTNWFHDLSPSSIMTAVPTVSEDVERQISQQRLGTIQRLDSFGRIRKEYTVCYLSEIGKGANKYVDQVILNPHSPKPLVAACATKISDSALAEVQLKKECSLSKKLRSLGVPNILTMRLIRTHPSYAENRLGALMEYCEGGDLLSYWTHHQLSRAEKLRLMLEICEAIAALHETGYCHLDLKTTNIVVSLNEQIPHIRLADFESMLPSGAPLLAKTSTFPPPEIRCHTVGLRPQASFATDLWALGDILYFCFKGKSLLSQYGLTWERDRNSYRTMASRLLFHVRLNLRSSSSPLDRLVASLLSCYPERRCSAREACTELRRLFQQQSV